MRAARLAMVAIALGALQSPAAAQPAASTRARAAARFKQGQEFFKARDYDHALAEYEAAYQLSREPLLVFNIALCHDRAQRPVEALEAFQRYLELVPSGDVADEAREDVARLTPVVEAIRSREAAAAAGAAEQARRADAARAADAAARAARDRERRDTDRVRRARDAERLEGRARIERWVGLAGAGLGAASLAAGAIYGLAARSAAADITDHRGPWTDRDLMRDADGRSAETRMVIFTTAGGAALIAGGALYLLGRHHDTEASQLRLEIQAGPAGSALSITGRF
jgi:tetratricopeptide (TPR) repeat protein